jgi:hypothetical protein
MTKQAHYNAAQHISPNTAPDPYNRPAFSLQDRLKRLAWNIVAAVLFRLSPRPFFAWRALRLQVLSGSQDLRAVESLMRRSGGRRRRSRNLQSGTDALRLARHPVPGLLPVRGHARLRRSRVSATDLRDGGWPLRLDLCARLCGSRSAGWRRCRARSGLRRDTQPGTLDCLRRSARDQSKRPPARKLSFSSSYFLSFRRNLAPRLIHLHT